MSARQLRRSFAAPFVITLASALPMAAACGPKPLPKHHNPPGPAGEGPHTNPPAPAAGSGSGEHHDHDHGQPPATPAPTEPGTPKADSGAPGKEPAKYEQTWTVMKFKGNADCQAMVGINCPKPEPGKAVPTCNPPPPIKYACPDGFKDGDTLKIVLRAGATDCFVDREMPKCPANAKCNPPPPRKVACPER